MKRDFFISLYFTLTFFICWSQNYKKVDSIVLNYDKRINSTSKIAKRIASDFSNDYDKVRAIYTWIANNIAYDPKESGKYNFKYSTKEEFIKKDKKFRKKLSSRVMSKRKAVCEGYATLFNVICHKLNIKSIVVDGDSKTTIRDIGRRYDSNHSWNIVKINNKNYLLDPTWGAGSYNNGFKKEANYFYFFTDPKLFIKSHYPDNYKNALIKKKISRKDFLNYPIYYNHDYSLITPISGIMKRGKSINFKFNTNGKKVNSISYSNGKDFFKIEKINNDEYLEFNVDSQNLTRAKKLVLYFDTKAIIAYRVR